MNDAGGHNTAGWPAGWDEFINSPVDYTDAARLSVSLEGEIGVAGCRQMLGHRRLAKRLSARLRSSYDLNDCAPPDSEQDRAIALTESAELRVLALKAGAIYWSNRLASLVLAPDVAAVTEALGDEFWMLALANRDLGAEARPLGAIDEAMAGIETDGWRCLSAWCCAQDLAIGRRVRLKLPPHPDLDAEPEGEIAERGAEIVRRAARKEETE